VFTNGLGEHLHPQTVYNHLKKVAGKAEAPDVCVHDLRHTYAVLSLQNGDDVKTVQGNLGHATAAFTLDVYGHVSEKMKKDSADRMQNYFASLDVKKA
jgi:integrase